MRYNLPRMSFLFHRKTKKALKVIWAVVAVLIILSMVVFFAPGLLNLFMPQAPAVPSAF